MESDLTIPDPDEPVVARRDLASDEDKQKALERIIDWFLCADHESIRGYVSKLRSQNPGIGDDNLARKIVRRKAVKNGWVGAVTGVPGVLLLPVTVPADLIATWKLQVHLILCIAHVYGHDASTTDLKTDILLVLAGDSAKEALKRFGIEVGKATTKKAVDKYITREVTTQIYEGYRGQDNHQSRSEVTHEFHQTRTPSGCSNRLWL
jgi:hypothetical protein